MENVISYVIQINDKKFSGVYRLRYGVSVETGLYLLLKLLKLKIPKMVEEVDKRVM